MRATLLVLLVSSAIATASSAAPSVRLSIHDGTVDLSASDASVADILNEWARVGGTRVVNTEQLPASRVTLQLDHVSESQALDILLRSAAGFIAVPRQVARSEGSHFERILILATSVAPPTPAAAATAAAPPPFAVPPPVRALPSGATPIVGPDGRPVADDQEGAPPPATPATTPASMPPGFSPPSPYGPPTSNGPQPASSTPVPISTPAPAAVGGAAVPGTIVKPLEQSQPRRPGGPD